VPNHFFFINIRVYRKFLSVLPSRRSKKATSFLVRPQAPKLILNMQKIFFLNTQYDIFKSHLIRQCRIKRNNSFNICFIFHSFSKICRTINSSGVGAGLASKFLPGAAKDKMWFRNTDFYAPDSPYCGSSLPAIYLINS
jgi:hypothetical protein